MKDQLIRDFDYDQWANARWLSALPSLPFAVRAEEILWHSVRCHRSWLVCAWSEEEIPAEAADLGQALREASQAWQEFLATSDPEAFAAVPRREGAVEFWSVGDLARHVLNHATYHRGHLRGLAEAAGYTAFPDTDRVFWYTEVGVPT